MTRDRRNKTRRVLILRSARTNPSAAAQGKKAHHLNLKRENHLALVAVLLGGNGGKKSNEKN